MIGILYIRSDPCLWAYLLIWCLTEYFSNGLSSVIISYTQYLFIFLSLNRVKKALADVACSIHELYLDSKCLRVNTLSWWLQTLCFSSTAIRTSSDAVKKDKEAKIKVIQLPKDCRGVYWHYQRLPWQHWRGTEPTKINLCKQEEGWYLTWMYLFFLYAVILV